jgi:hypothetical protein
MLSSNWQDMLSGLLKWTGFSQKVGVSNTNAEDSGIPTRGVAGRFMAL